MVLGLEEFILDARHIGSGSCLLALAKARSGLVSVFQHLEMNEWGSFGLHKSTASAEEDQSARKVLSWFEVLYP